VFVEQNARLGLMFISYGYVIENGEQSLQGKISGLLSDENVKKRILVFRTHLCIERNFHECCSLLPSFGTGQILLEHIRRVLFRNPIFTGRKKKGRIRGFFRILRYIPFHE
jgi:hypothetical protein